MIEDHCMFYNFSYKDNIELILDKIRLGRINNLWQQNTLDKEVYIPHKFLALSLNLSDIPICLSKNHSFLGVRSKMHSLDDISDKNSAHNLPWKI